MNNILLLGAGGNAGMNFMRSIRAANAGYKFIGCDIDKYSLASADCESKYWLPQQSPAEKLDYLNKIILREEVNFVHAQPDREVEFLIRNATELLAPTFPHRLHLWELFSNKLRCQQIWRDVLNLSFECQFLTDVIKTPALFARLTRGSDKAWFRAISGAGSRAALPVSTVDQAIAWANYWVLNKGMRLEEFMLAEFLPGHEYAVQTFWVNGDLVESQARQRLVYFFGNIMPSGQSSTPAVAVTTNERDVYDTAYRAILAIDPTPHGVYCVDLKRNTADVVIPLEVNYGRFFTTSDFFAALGVNTPLNYLNYSLTGRLTYNIEPVKTKHFWLRGLDKVPQLASELDISFQPI